MLSLWMVRHGETDWNHAGRIQGWSDIPLNEQGKSQSERLASWLHGIPFQGLYTSDLLRATETADALSLAIGLSYHTDARLRERGFGCAEGLKREEIHRLYPDGVPDQESAESLSNRAKEFLHTIQTHKTGRFLAVSHGGYIRNLLTVLGHQDVPPLANTSVTRLTWNGTTWQAGSISWAGHLTSEEKLNTRPQYREPTG